MSGAFYTDNLKSEVKTKFLKIETISQLASLLNYIEKKCYPDITNVKKITARTLTYLSLTTDLRYKEFKIKKKGGGERHILAPDNHLLRIQGLLNILFQILYENKFHFNTNGFILNRDILRNAQPHVNKNFVLNLDIKDYFPNINFRRVKTVFSLAPLNFIEEKEKLGFILANICCYKGFLPQGSPTSPIISNMVTQRLDRKISKYCSERKVKYSRYADDLSFSSNKNILRERFIKGITKIIVSENFQVNENKTRLRKSMDRQLVTGIVVNEKPNVNRKYIKKVRAILKNWEVGGEEYAQKIFQANYEKIVKGTPDFKNVSRGYIDFIGLVRGKEDSVYLKLIQKHSFLTNKINYNFISHSAVRKKLVEDNKKMEMIPFDSLNSPDIKFVNFCTSAFHQIENLLNYLYWKRFKIDDFIDFLYDNNPQLKKRWRKHKPYNTPYRKLDINLKVYAYEKEFYYDKHISYDKSITLLREARNDDSHRCQVESLNINEVKKEYALIKKRNQRYLKNYNKFRPLSNTEEKTKTQYKLIRLLEDKDYNRVRKILNSIVKEIKNYQFPIKMKVINQ